MTNEELIAHIELGTIWTFREADPNHPFHAINAHYWQTKVVGLFNDQVEMYFLDDDGNYVMEDVEDEDDAGYESDVMYITDFIDQYFPAKITPDILSLSEYIL